MKKLLVVLLVIGMVLSFAGCSGQKDPEPTGPVEVTYWHTYTEHHNDYLNALVEEFNKSQNEVHVTAVQQPYQDYDANLLQAVRNGVGPDVCSRYSNEVIEYIADDLLVDFAPYINDKEIGIPTFKSDMVGKLYGEVTQFGEDKIYMIPVICTSEVYYYNKTLFDELGLKAPTTWKELEEVSRTIYQKTGKPGWGSDSLMDTFAGIIIQKGSGYINPTTKKVEFDNDIALETLKWLKSCIDEGIFRLVGDDYYFSGPFTSGAVASYTGSSAGVGYATANDGKFEVGCAPIMQDAHGYIPSWGGGMVCFKSTPEREKAAYKSLKYFSSTEVAAKWAIEFGASPAYTSSLNTPEYQEYTKTNIAAAALAAEMPNLNWLSGIYGSSTVRTEIDKMLLTVLTGQATPEDALKACVDACNAALNEH